MANSTAVVMDFVRGARTCACGEKKVVWGRRALHERRAAQSAPPAPRAAGRGHRP
eukprot:gene19929-6849_t